LASTGVAGCNKVAVNRIAAAGYMARTIPPHPSGVGYLQPPPSAGAPCSGPRHVLQSCCGNTSLSVSMKARRPGGRCRCPG
jgi:hypothetical protein